MAANEVAGSFSGGAADVTGNPAGRTWITWQNHAGDGWRTKAPARLLMGRFVTEQSLLHK